MMLGKWLGKLRKRRDDRFDMLMLIKERLVRAASHDEQWNIRILREYRTRDQASIERIKAALSAGSFADLPASDADVLQDIIVVFLATPTSREPLIDHWVALLLLQPFELFDVNDLLWSFECRGHLDPDILSKKPVYSVIPRSRPV